MLAWNRRRDKEESFRHNGDFHPLPFLGNAHVQTILGHWLTSWGLEPGTTEHFVSLPDGDKLVLHENRQANGTRGGATAVLIHGLGGSHQSGPVKRLAARLVSRGLRVVRLDLRGSGKGAALASKLYYGGCSADIRAALAEIRRWDPAAPIHLAGFSLGGNIALKVAAEASDHPVPGLASVAAVAPPIDLSRSSSLLSRPRNRIYERHFVHVLLHQVSELERRLPVEARLRWPRRLTLRRFDDIYTAPRNGFRNAQEYYERSSTHHRLDRIGVPTFVLASRDDPFVSVEPIEALPSLPMVKVRILPRGGHMGFLGWSGDGTIRWAEKQTADWILANTQHH